MRRKGWVLGVAIIVLVALAIGARDEVMSELPVDTEHVILASTYHLEKTVEKDLVVVAESIDLTADSRIIGDAALVGSKVTLAGRIQGDLAVVADTLRILPDAEVTGDVILMAGQSDLAGRIDGDLHVRGQTVSFDPEAQVAGAILACTTDVIDARTEGATPVGLCSDSDALAVFEPYRALEQLRLNAEDSEEWGAFGLVGTLLGALTTAGFAALVVTIFPQQIGAIETAIRSAPRRLCAMGFVLTLAALGVSALVTLLLAVLPPIGLLLLPFYLLALVGFGALALAGWITLALLIGNWLLRRVIDAALPPLVSVTLGSVLLMFLWYLLMLLPLGAVLALLGIAMLGSLGLGAVLETRLGTRPLQLARPMHG